MDKFPSIKVPKDYGNREEDSLEFKLSVVQFGDLNRLNLQNWNIGSFQKND